MGLMSKQPDISLNVSITDCRWNQPTRGCRCYLLHRRATGPEAMLRKTASYRFHVTLDSKANIGFYTPIDSVAKLNNLEAGTTSGNGAS